MLGASDLLMTEMNYQHVESDWAAGGAQEPLYATLETGEPQKKLHLSIGSSSSKGCNLSDSMSDMSDLPSSPAKAQKVTTFNRKFSPRPSARVSEKVSQINKGRRPRADEPHNTYRTAQKERAYSIEMSPIMRRSVPTMKKERYISPVR